MANTILDPTGLGQARDEHPKAAFTLSPRRADLRGATVGLLATPKQNADIFVEEVGRLLREHEGVADVITRTKTSVAMPASDEIADELAGRCDAVVTGVGDCGSCSASAVADGVVFETRGTPTAVVCSDAFLATADAMAQTQGAPGYRYVTTQHPVAVLTPEEVRERATEALPEITSLLVDAPARGEAS